MIAYFGEDCEGGGRQDANKGGPISRNVLGDPAVARWSIHFTKHLDISETWTRYLVARNHGFANRLSLSRTSADGPFHTTACRPVQSLLYPSAHYQLALPAQLAFLLLLQTPR